MNVASSYGFEVHTLNRETSNHPNHSSFDVGLSADQSSSRCLPPHFVDYFQIVCDVVWMPSSYKAKIYGPSFFTRFLPSLVCRLAPGGLIHLPAAPHIFGGIIKAGLLGGGQCLLRFLTQEQVKCENVLAIVGEAYICKSHLGKHPPSTYHSQPHFGLSLQDCSAVCKDAELLSFHPAQHTRPEPRVVGLVIKK